MGELTKEEWKYIPNYEGIYKINTIGEVINTITNKPIKSQKLKNGYMCISLYKNKKRKTYKLHRLVAITFIENVGNKEQVNHKDGNKINNFVENLEWCTQSENQKHAFKNGLNYGRKGIQNGHHRKVSQYDKCMNFIKTWDYMTEIEEKLKINISNICNCCRGKIKSTGNYIFRYESEDI